MFVSNDSALSTNDASRPKGRPVEVVTDLMLFSSRKTNQFRDSEDKIQNNLAEIITNLGDSALNALNLIAVVSPSLLRAFP